MWLQVEARFALELGTVNLLSAGYLNDCATPEVSPSERGCQGRVAPLPGPFLSPPTPSVRIDALEFGTLWLLTLDPAQKTRINNGTTISHASKKSDVC